MSFVHVVFYAVFGVRLEEVHQFFPRSYVWARVTSSTTEHSLVKFLLTVKVKGERKKKTRAVYIDPSGNI